MTHRNNAQHQAAARAKKAQQGLKEVRGAWAAPEDHTAVREHALKLTRKRTRQPK